MPLYEFIFLVRQDVSQAQVQSLGDHFKNVIEEGGGVVSKVEYCGLRSLAYRINRSKKAHYVLLNVQAESKVLDDVEHQMRLHEDIFRSLRVRVEKLDPNPSPLVQTRFYREKGEDTSVPPSPHSETPSTPD